ncbi:MAG: CHAT domain-containing protein, partial [Myxococcota bacterium]
VLSAEQEILQADLAAKLAEIERSSFDFERLPRFGAELADLVLPEEIQQALAGVARSHLVVVHDEGASRIPWETLSVGGRALAGGRGISRRYVAQNLSPAKWLAERITGEALDVLVVVNPTEDLEGAEREGKRLQRLFGAQSRLRIQKLEGPQATRKRLLDAFCSGDWDVIHYAGHAYFDALHPARSGILCHGGEVLAGSDLASLSNLPSLVFFNACESSRIRSARTKAKGKEPRDIAQRIERNVSFAEAFLRGGIANYVGTYWPVGDASAELFATAFYGGLLAGRTLGEALAEAREKLRGEELVDWADYVHFGSYDFVVKAPAS